MDGVTDVAFRSILTSYGKPDLMITEFVHVMALWHGKPTVYDALRFEQSHRPIIAQIFGIEPEYFYKAAHIVCELGFDGIDINMGCPANTIVRRGGGAQLIRTPRLAQEIIHHTQKGVTDWAHRQTLADLKLSKEKITFIAQNSKLEKENTRKAIPISIKTRIGYDSNTINEWIKYLIEAKPNAITVHGRTYKQLYMGVSDWEAIASVADSVRSKGIVYLGNGDIKNRQDGVQKCSDYGLDGVLIGRAALGNPWAFNNISDKHNFTDTTKQKLNILLEHARMHDQYYNDKQFPAIKKHLGWYCNGFSGAKQLRTKLMSCQNYFDVEEIVMNFKAE